MIVNVGKYTGDQFTDEETVRIWKDGELIRQLPARKNLSYEELVKVVELYTGGGE